MFLANGTRQILSAVRTMAAPRELRHTSQVCCRLTGSWRISRDCFMAKLSLKHQFAQSNIFLTKTTYDIFLLLILACLF